MSSGWIAKDKRQYIYNRDNLVCVYCGRKCVNSRGNMSLDKERFATLDHVIPRIVGGTHHSTNIMVACNHHNSKRRSIPIKQYCTEQGLNYIQVYYRIMQRRLKEKI